MGIKASTSLPSSHSYAVSAMVLPMVMGDCTFQYGVLKKLLYVRRTVHAVDKRGYAGCICRCVCTESRGIVAAEDSYYIGMSGQKVRCLLICHLLISLGILLLC